MGRGVLVVIAILLLLPKGIAGKKTAEGKAQSDFRG